MVSCKPNTADIIDLVSVFRDLVNEPRMRRSLAKNQSRWNKLCSAMDLIEDTSMAVRSYSSQSDTSDKGKLYLETYGLLQGLKLRQDAVFDLCDALGSRRSKGGFPGLDNVRSARVSVAGHPTKKQREGGGPHHLVQMSLRRNSLQIMSASANGPKFTHIRLNDLIHGQEAELTKILTGVITDLREAELKHKAQFRGSKLEAVFPNSLSYSFEKIYEHIQGGPLAGLGVWGVEQVRTTLTEYRRALEARDIQIDTYDAIKYHYELLAYPLDQHQSARTARRKSSFR